MRMRRRAPAWLLICLSVGLVALYIAAPYFVFSSSQQLDINFSDNVVSNEADSSHNAAVQAAESVQKIARRSALAGRELDYDTTKTDVEIQTQTEIDSSLIDSTFKTAPNDIPPTKKPSILAIISRYHEDINWLTDPNAGIMTDNSTGTPKFILPFEIYQVADIDKNNSGLPIFPGLLVETDRQNSSAKPPPPQKKKETITPTWPEWAWNWAAVKNATMDLARPGSVEEAALIAKKKVGFPDKIPETAEEWRALEQAGNLGSTDKDANFTLLFGNTTQFNVTFPSQAQIKEIFSAADNKNKSSSTVIVETINKVLPLKIVPNRGAESMAYISAIIDHYDNLPDLMVFMHAHRVSWHTILSQDWTLRRLATQPLKDPTLAASNGYHALGCLERHRNDISQLWPTMIDANYLSNNGERWHEALSARFSQAWREHLGEAYQMPLPDYVRVPTAASFAASNQAILRRPKSFYVGLREWMLKTTIENKWLGIVMEFQTGIMVANMSHITFSQEKCFCELYGVCTSYAQI